MYKGKFEGRHDEEKAPACRKRGPRRNHLTAMAAATAVLLVLAISGTLAWLSTKDQPIQNKFLPSKVTCEVTEKFDGADKTKVNVKNTGDISAYIRVKLVTYRTNDAGEHIGGAAAVPSFTPGDGWTAYDGYYYYTKPVAPGKLPDANLAERITLKESYEDADGGHQSMDVVAEAIQSIPVDAIRTAWGAGFSINPVDGSLIVPNN